MQLRAPSNPFQQKSYKQIAVPRLCGRCGKGTIEMYNCFRERNPEEYRDCENRERQRGMQLKNGNVQTRYGTSAERTFAEAELARSG
jgi:hypothetical protein